MVRLTIREVHNNFVTIRASTDTSRIFTTIPCLQILEKH